MLTEGIDYQDWAATHGAVGAKRRIRIYAYGSAASPDARAALARQAKREFSVLEGVDSPGIVKVLEYKETELGHALIFEFDPAAERLDHFMQRCGAQLDIGTRLHIIRSLAETIAYAHKRRLYHRALGPSCVLVRQPRPIRASRCAFRS
ncbi:MAG: protein kinase [Burkholderiaceae bacterium]|nr:protein kinase [Burkholderiaceae bacterium]